MSAPCHVCGSRDGVRHFAVLVDDEPLRLQPNLCAEHGDAYIFQIGAVFGAMIRKEAEKPKVPR